MTLEAAYAFKNGLVIGAGIGVGFMGLLLLLADVARWWIDRRGPTPDKRKGR